MGTIEWLEDKWQWLWDFLLNQAGLRFACLGFEEGVELEDAKLTVETFPWHEWPTVVGALRLDPAASGDWIIRSNPNFSAGHGWITREH